MSQRTLAGLIAVPALVALWVAAALLPVPFVTYEPGPTVDVLGERDGDEIIDVQGRQTYRDDGQLRLTTVLVTQPETTVNLFSAIGAWLDDEQAVYPYDAVYAEDETRDQADLQSSLQMVSSQDAAIAAALSELEVDYEPVVEVLNVEEGRPAAGKLELRDVILAVDGQQIADAQDVVRIVGEREAGASVEFTVRRDGERRTVAVEPEETPAGPKVGIVPGRGFQFPFDVRVRIPERIGGPSAGLTFSLAIYDTLTPGSLTGGKAVAGTGTITEEGEVGPIGGIQQKIIASARDGAELFLVPPDNCGAALAAAVKNIRLVRAPTLHDARLAVEAWSDDPEADLPACTEEG